MSTATAAGSLLGGVRTPPAPGEPAWLARAREGAADWVAGHGFPDRHDEDWRYLSLEPILSVPFEAPEPPDESWDGELATASVPQLGGPRLVFVDGRLAPALSALAGLPSGVTVTGLASVLERDPGAVQPLLDGDPSRYPHAFAAINLARFEDGAFVHIQPGTAVDTPIHLAFLTRWGPTPRLSSPRSIIWAGAGSRAAIVVTHHGAAGHLGCTNAVTEVRCDEDAQLEYYEVQEDADTASHLALVEVHQGPGSRFASRVVALGSAIARHELRVHLGGEHAEADLDGLYLPSGEQHHDHPVLVEHLVPRCASRQRYKGVVGGRGHGVFNGRIVVHPGADGTDADQSNKNLLLSDRAEVDTRPRLEIFADDVRCSHGAAVGQLDADALFYLRSRGIPLGAARSMLVEAFAEEMIQRIPLEPLRSYVAGRVTERVSTAEQGAAL